MNCILPTSCICICRLLCRNSSFLSFTLYLHLTHTPLSDCTERQACFMFSMVMRVLVTMAFSCWKADYSQGRSVCLDFFIPDEQHCPLWPWNHRNLLLPLSHAQTGIRHVYWPFKKTQEKKKSSCFEETHKTETLFFFGQFNFSRSTESVPISAIWSYRPILHFLLL